jgi:hypothetical protein
MYPIIEIIGVQRVAEIHEQAVRASAVRAARSANKRLSAEKRQSQGHAAERSRLRALGTLLTPRVS